jgi:hypothetical protein
MGSKRLATAPGRLGPRVRLEMRLDLECELLEGGLPDLPRIVADLAEHIEQRHRGTGMLAAREWAVLVTKASVSGRAAYDLT